MNNTENTKSKLLRLNTCIKRMHHRIPTLNILIQKIAKTPMKKRTKSKKLLLNSIKMIKREYPKPNFKWILPIIKLLLVCTRLFHSLNNDQAYDSLTSFVYF